MSLSSEALFQEIARHSSLATLHEYLGSDLAAVIASMFSPPASGTGLESAAEAALPAGLVSDDHPIIAAGRRAVDALQAGANLTRLSSDEMEGLEAIILLRGRPALFIQGGSFFGVPNNWAILNDERRSIERNIPSVGRIEYAGALKSDWAGTGFVVAPDVLMTNRHVVAEFKTEEAGGKWQLDPQLQVWVDFQHEVDVDEHQRVSVVELIGVHPFCDLALLRLNPGGTDRGICPPSLTLAGSPPSVIAEHLVYTIGHPGWTADPMEEAHAREIFDGIIGVKRLQPGRLRALTQAVYELTHTSSTLPGSSGSPVIDLERHLVLGLHWGGSFRRNNYAIPLWLLYDDPLLVAAGVAFV